LRRIKSSGRKIFTQFNALIIYEDEESNQKRPEFFFGTLSGICRKQLQSAKKAVLNDIYIFQLVKANSPFVEEKKFEQNSSPCLLNALKAEKVSNFCTPLFLAVATGGGHTEYTHCYLTNTQKKAPFSPVPTCRKTSPLRV
jgi:hypothetical protein